MLTDGGWFGGAGWFEANGDAFLGGVLMVEIPDHQEGSRDIKPMFSNPMPDGVHRVLR